MPEHYRMASWWLRWDDLDWPKPDLQDKIRRRADLAAESKVNCAVIFGAHFRWDFLPLWNILHDMMHFIADELHQRDIRLFDHHSATLTHRYRTMEQRMEMYRNNRHHVSFCPSIEAAAEWRFHGKLLNDWRMIDFSTQEPVFLDGYTAEEFCFNHPDFIASYQEYVKKLISETAIDGLMCDDAVFYPRFYSCGCRHCRERFGEPLPDIADLNFWGNWQNPAFLRWIQMRYQSVQSFNQSVRDVLPPDFPLMNCCSSSILSSSNEYAISYEEFVPASNLVMLEMCGNTPDLDGNFTESLASQLHHLALAAKYGIPCVGLGYGFTEKSAEFLWAFNQFLGSDMWFSMLTHRLDMNDADLAQFPDDVALVKTAFTCEKQHPDYFDGESLAATAVFFSRQTRDNYGGYMADYSHDFIDCCRELFDNGYDIRVVLDIPSPESAIELLVIPSAALLTQTEQNALEAWLAAGKQLIATGPFGLLPDFLPDFKRTEKFPHDTWEAVEPGRCSGKNHWHLIRENFRWHPCRMHDNLSLPLPNLSRNGFFHRKFRNKQGEIITHYLAKKYQIGLDSRREAKRHHINGNNIIDSIAPLDICQEWIAEEAGMLFFPFYAAPFPVKAGEKIALPDGCYYFLFKSSLQIHS